MAWSSDTRWKRGTGGKWRPYVPCKGCLDGSCNGWIFRDRLSNIGPVCTVCGEEWQTDAEQAATLASVSWKIGGGGASSKGKGGAKKAPWATTKNDWGAQKASADEDKLWNDALSKGRDSQLMGYFKEKYPHSRRLKTPAEVPTTTVLSKTSKHISAIKQEVQASPKTQQKCSPP